MVVPNNNNVISTVRHKIEKYAELAGEIKRQWRVKTKVLSVIVSTTGVVPHSTVRAMNELGGTMREIQTMQKAAVLHTTISIARKIIGDQLSS
jgi:hypothetical protein